MNDEGQEGGRGEKTGDNGGDGKEEGGNICVQGEG